MDNEPPQCQFNLVCTKCGHVLAEKVDEDMKKLMQAGFCNWGSCKGELEWQPV